MPRLLQGGDFLSQGWPETGETGGPGAARVDADEDDEDAEGYYEEEDDEDIVRGGNLPDVCGYIYINI